MSQRVAELYGSKAADDGADWDDVVRQSHCHFLDRRCQKTRKSEPSVTIGTCSVHYSDLESPVILCPHRFLESGRIFSDAVHLLGLHEPGNDLHLIPEFTVPGGSVDYLLVSSRRSQPLDFVGIEIQAIDSTGTVWPARERFLNSVGAGHDPEAVWSDSRYGMNWKMTAKTTLVQLHHKLMTFENVNRKMVLVLQDHLLEYMRREFRFDKVAAPSRVGDSLFFHSYSLDKSDSQWKLELTSRASTDINGMALALDLKADGNVELSDLLHSMRGRLTPATRFRPV